MKRSDVTPLAGMAPGFFLQLYGLATASLGWCAAGSLLLLIASTLLVIAKGYHPAWGFWGLVPVLGPLLLLIQPVRHVFDSREELQEILLEEDPANHPAPHQPDRIRGGRLPLVILAPLSVLVMVSLPFWPRDVAMPVPAPDPVIPSVAEVAAPTSVNTPTLVVQPPAPAEPPVADTAPPAPVPAVEASVAPPASGPAVAPGSVPVAAPVVPKPPTPEEVFEFNYGKIRMGMTEEEVTILAGDDLGVVADGQYRIVRWEGPGGLSFAARFQNARLDGLTVLHRPAEQVKQEELVAELMKKESLAPEKKEKAEKEETPAPPKDEEEAASREEAPAETEAEPAPAESGDDEAGPPEERSRVVRLTHPPQSSGRVTYRNAKLPAYSIPLDRGPHDVVIKNPSKSTLKVGVRSGKFGTDITVGPNGRAVIYLKNGQYSLFYIDPDDPETLHESGSFSVQSPPGPILVPLK